jgi:hypothetical protein
MLCSARQWAGALDPMHEVARVERTAQNEKRFVTSLSVTASCDAESAEASDDPPTLLQPTITSYKGQAFVPGQLRAVRRQRHRAAGRGTVR